MKQIRNKIDVFLHIINQYLSKQFMDCRPFAGDYFIYIRLRASADFVQKDVLFYMHLEIILLQLHTFISLIFFIFVYTPQIKGWNLLDACRASFKIRASKPICIASALK